MKMLLCIFFFFSLKSIGFTLTFEEILIESSVKEEENNGTAVVDLRSYVRSLSSLNNSNGYVLKFVRPCPNFYIDEKSPFTVRSLKLDREELCPYEKNCFLTCKLILQREETKLIELKIRVEDVNDHKPRFRKNFYSYELDENISVGFRFQLEQAEDKDLLETNSIRNYSLNPLNASFFPFELHFDLRNHLLELILVDALEKKQKEIFLFELIAIGEDEQEDKCLIQLNILENRENHSLPPSFDSSFYEFFVHNLNETFIGRVHARHDPNSNSVASSNANNTRIYYRLILSKDNADLFDVNETTGEIFLNRKSEVKALCQFYELLVEAFYSNYLSSLATVHVYFNSTSRGYDDHRNSEHENFIQILVPKLYQKSGNEIVLKENSAVPLTILQLFVSSALPFALDMETSINENHFYLKQLDQQFFELTLLKPLDFESVRSVHFDFYLNKQNSSRKSIEIIVQNINDCEPMFNQTEFVFKLQENNPMPFLLYTFEAFDEDDLYQTTYRLETSDEDVFTIDSTSGQFWVTKSLDREVQTNYSLTVCAFDGIYQSCSSILLNVLDENDHVCRFNTSSVTVNIEENVAADIDLIQVRAFDPDYLQNGTLQYKLSPKTPHLNIDPTTGVIRTTQTAFDYESIQSYSSSVIACDNVHSIPSLCCVLELNVNVLDLNDNLPYLIYPPSIDDVFVINFTNRVMPRLKAFDNDLDPKHRFISYSIVAGSLNSSISIDHLSGQLFLLSTAKLPLYGTLVVSISSQTKFHLRILIHDHQTDPRIFLMSLEQLSFSSQLFYFISFVSIAIAGFLLLVVFLVLYFFKRKQKHDADPLMNTPSTTTISARSLLTTTTSRKAYDTYYSFGDGVLPEMIHV